MALNIESAEAHKLARKLASVTGQSLTEAVTEAIRYRLSLLELAGRSPGRRGRRDPGLRRLPSGPGQPLSGRDPGL